LRGTTRLSVVPRPSSPNRHFVPPGIMDFQQGTACFLPTDPIQYMVPEFAAFKSASFEQIAPASMRFYSGPHTTEVPIRPVWWTSYRIIDIVRQDPSVVVVGILNLSFLWCDQCWSRRGSPGRSMPSRGGAQSDADVVRDIIPVVLTTVSLISPFHRINRSRDKLSGRI